MKKWKFYLIAAGIVLGFIFYLIWRFTSESRSNTDIIDDLVDDQLRSIDDERRRISDELGRSTGRSREALERLNDESKDLERGLNSATNGVTKARELIRARLQTIRREKGLS